MVSDFTDRMSYALDVVAFDSFVSFADAVVDVVVIVSTKKTKLSGTIFAGISFFPRTCLNDDTLK